MSSTTSIVELLLVLLLAASVVALLCNRWRIPYTIALVFAGFAIDLFRPQIVSVLESLGFPASSHFEILTPEVIFTLFLPGLLFESSLHLNRRQLQQNLLPISMLAIAGVIVATLATGYALASWISLPLGSALVFGALISATDPISVVALFRELGVHPRLTLLVEGESLFNDGTAVVLFQILLATALTGTLSLTAGVAQFLMVVLGGIVVGLSIGYLGSKVISRVDEFRIEITLTTIVAYGSYLVAEHLHVSGVIATVVAGLVVGDYGVEIGMSARTRVALYGFWEYFAFVINSLVFLLIGVSVHVSDLVRAAGPIAIATVAVILGRLITVYTLAPISNRFSAPIPIAWRHVLFWGGLHGSVSMALALGLPPDLPARSLILSMTFGVVAFSIVVQGLTMKPLVSWLGLVQSGTEEYDRLKANQLATASARGELMRLFERRLISKPIFDELTNELEHRLQQIEGEIVVLQRERTDYLEEERRIARHHLAMAEKSALTRAVASGMISEQSAEPCLERVNEQLDHLAS